jgi:hypothetical protein
MFYSVYVTLQFWKFADLEGRVHPGMVRSLLIRYLVAFLVFGISSDILLGTPGLMTVFGLISGIMATIVIVYRKNDRLRTSRGDEVENRTNGTVDNTADKIDKDH